MKKLIIVSDTHGNPSGLESISSLIAENDYLIHLGDGANDLRELRTRHPDKVYACSGNCDFYSPIPEDGILEVERLSIYFCHGHRYGVKSDLYALAQAAKARGCEIALYGHTHIAKISEVDGVTLINPGSLRYPLGKGGSYCYLVISKDKATPVLVGEQYC